MAVFPAPTSAARPALGPNAAMESLYAEHVTRVHGYCLRFLRDRSEAEDAVQTTFIYALRALRRGIRPEFEAAWLLAIARNVCLSRREASDRRRDFEVTRDVHVLDETAAAAAGDRLQDEMIRLEQALNDLPEVQRRVIVLREWQGLSYREIATALDLSVAAVETHIFRARRALASRLADDDAPEPPRRHLARLNAGSMLLWLKSPFAAGGALKAAAAFVAVSGGLAVTGSMLQPQPQRPASPTVKAATPRAEVSPATGVTAARAAEPAVAKGPRARANAEQPAPEPAPLNERPAPRLIPTLIPEAVDTPVTDTTRALDEHVDLNGLVARLPPLPLETPNVAEAPLP